MQTIYGMVWIALLVVVQTENASLTCVEIVAIWDCTDEGGCWGTSSRPLSDSRDINHVDLRGEFWTAGGGLHFIVGVERGLTNILGWGVLEATFQQPPNMLALGLYKAVCLTWTRHSADLTKRDLPNSTLKVRFLPLIISYHRVEKAPTELITRPQKMNENWRRNEWTTWRFADYGETWLSLPTSTLRFVWEDWSMKKIGEDIVFSWLLVCRKRTRVEEGTKKPQEDLLMMVKLDWVRQPQRWEDWSMEKIGEGNSNCFFLVALRSPIT